MLLGKGLVRWELCHGSLVEDCHRRPYALSDSEFNGISQVLSYIQYLVSLRYSTRSDGVVRAACACKDLWRYDLHKPSETASENLISSPGFASSLSNWLPYQEQYGVRFCDSAILRFYEKRSSMDACVTLSLLRRAGLLYPRLDHESNCCQVASGMSRSIRYTTAGASGRLARSGKARFSVSRTMADLEN